MKTNTAKTPPVNIEQLYHDSLTLSLALGGLLGIADAEERYADGPADSYAEELLALQKIAVDIEAAARELYQQTYRNAAA